MLNKFVEILAGFFDLFIPSKCLSCGIGLLEHEEFVCTECLFKIPKTNFHKNPENELSKVFWGRVHFQFASSFYYFTKGSVLQQLIHEIKYKQLKELAYSLGREFGNELKNTEIHNDLDFLVPVPLHPLKEKKRGYNQSEWIAKGIGDALNIEVLGNTLKREIYTSSQTKKNKAQRWENVKDAFRLNNIQQIENKHIAIIDDVITTGATIEACCNNLLQVSGTRVSILSLAFATD